MLILRGRLFRFCSRVRSAVLDWGLVLASLCNCREPWVKAGRPLVATDL